jgi:hypothetical protein
MMKRKRVGYFDGTDPAVLTSLTCDGCDTIPISNGLDNHGQHVRQLNEENKVDILLGYLHKIYAPEGEETQAADIFHICQTYQIHFLVIVPREQHVCAREKFAHCPSIVQFVDPSDVLATARQLLSVS